MKILDPSPYILIVIIIYGCFFLAVLYFGFEKQLHIKWKKWKKRKNTYKRMY